MLLLRERPKFSPARRKVKIAAGIAKAMSRTNFGLTTLPEKIAAVRSKNEFLEVPYKFSGALARRSSPHMLLAGFSSCIYSLANRFRLLIYTKPAGYFIYFGFGAGLSIAQNTALISILRNSGFLKSSGCPSDV